MSGINAINLGAGNDLLILELVSVFKNEKAGPFSIVGRRPDDVKHITPIEQKLKNQMGS